MRGGDALHAIERLQPALRLTRLGRLGAKALDEALQVRDLALLLLEHRLLHRELGRALHLERGVIAGIQREPAGADVRDVGYAGIEEIAIVRDEDQGAAIACKPFLQPHHGIEIEMVGGFVEQQQVGAAHQRLGEI